MLKILDKKVIEFTLGDVCAVIAIWFVIGLLVVGGFKVFGNIDLLELPCPELGDMSVGALPVRCFEYYKIN